MIIHHTMHMAKLWARTSWFNRWDYKCEKCNTMKDLSQHKSHSCKRGNEMVLWDYRCLECGSLMGKEESGVYDML